MNKRGKCGGEPLFLYHDDHGEAGALRVTHDACEGKTAQQQSNEVHPPEQGHPRPAAIQAEQAAQVEMHPDANKE